MEKYRLNGQQIAVLVVGRGYVAIEEVVAVDGAAKLYDGVGEEIGCGEEWVERAHARQLTLVDGRAMRQHLRGAVPLLVDVAVVVNGAVEIVAQHERQCLVGWNGARGDNHKVALCGLGANVAQAFVIEPCSKHCYLIVAGKRLKVLLKFLGNGSCTVGVESHRVGDNCRDAGVKGRLLLLDDLQVHIHVGIHFAHGLPERRITVEQEEHAICEIVVALPQVAYCGEQRNVLLNHYVGELMGGRGCHDK